MGKGISRTVKKLNSENKVEKHFRNELEGTRFFENGNVEYEWLTTKEAACFIRVSVNALLIMVHRNQLPVFRFGRRLRFKKAELKALFERRGI